MSADVTSAAAGRRTLGGRFRNQTAGPIGMPEISFDSANKRARETCTFRYGSSIASSRHRQLLADPDIHQCP